MSLLLKICCWKNINKLGKKNFTPNLQYFQFEQKQNLFHEDNLNMNMQSKDLEDLSRRSAAILNGVKSGHLQALGNNTYTRKSSSKNTYSKSILEILKRCEICRKLTIKTPERLFTVFSINLIHYIYT